MLKGDEAVGEPKRKQAASETQLTLAGLEDIERYPEPKDAGSLQELGKGAGRVCPRASRKENRSLVSKTHCQFVT